MRSRAMRSRLECVRLRLQPRCSKRSATFQGTLPRSAFRAVHSATVQGALPRSAFRCVFSYWIFGLCIFCSVLLIPPCRFPRSPFLPATFNLCATIIAGSAPDVTQKVVRCSFGREPAGAGGGAETPIGRGTALLRGHRSSIPVEPFSTGRVHTFSDAGSDLPDSPSPATSLVCRTPFWKFWHGAA